MPSRQVAALWGVAQKTVNAYRRGLRIALSWQQARASQEYREGQQLRTLNFVAHTRERWRAWREERPRTFQRRKQEFEQLAAPPPMRICSVCGQQWFATKDFYHVQTRCVGKRPKITVSARPSVPLAATAPEKPRTTWTNACGITQLLGSVRNVTQEK
jgi:hypothetical protein